ncbi:MAG: alpha/beta hydrolase [Deltaproteobacteria bacterium]|nr:alpha/beta hydrolase [Deltaproteobacteria bacterium]
MSLPGRLLDVDGVRLFFYRSGDRAPNTFPKTGSCPLLLLHGYQLSHWQFRHVVPKLEAAGHEVIALDLPGHGESDRPAPEDYSYSAAAFLETIVRFLGILAVERVTVIGHSLGGGLALFLAARRAEHVDRIVVIDPLVYPFLPRAVATLASTPILAETVFSKLMSRWLIKHHLRQRIYADPALATDDWVDYLWERVNRPGSVGAGLATLRLVAWPDVFSRFLPAVKARTLVLWGENDRMFPSTWAGRLASGLERAESRIIPCCGHSPAEENPELVSQAILEFLSAEKEDTRSPIGDHMRATA